jgi:hypothetical protein
MAEFLNTAQQLFGVLGSFTSGIQTARGFSESAKAASAAGDFNARVEQFNAEKKLKADARQIQRILGKQGVQAAASGFRSGSKSFLAIKAAGLSELERQIVEQRQASKLRQDVARWQAEQQAAAFKARASAARSRNYQQLGQNITGLLNLFD